MSQSGYIDQRVPSEEIEKRHCAVRVQTDGVGLRMGNVSEFTLVAPLKEGGAKIFRERVAQAQIEANYWEGKLGTVHDLRVALINNDTQILFAATYSDEFKPYVEDVIKFATPWIDHMFLDVADGYPGLDKPEALAYIQKYQVQASMWYVENNQLSVRDVARGQRVVAAFNELLDALQN